MPDLRNSPITGSSRTLGDNYRRAFDGFSRFGTRKLAFHTIWIYNIDQATMDQLMNWELTDRTFPEEYIFPAGSLMEAIERGVQLIAEPYIWSEWDFNPGDYPDHYDLFMSFAVAADTVMDGHGQRYENVAQRNFNSYDFESAIADAIGDTFIYDGIYVQRATLAGDGLYEYGGSSIARGTRPGVSSAKKAAITAAGKSLYKRNK